MSMHPVQIADVGFLPLPPERIADYLHQHKDQWHDWFPGLTLRVSEDRGTLGIRWITEGAVEGTSEIWLERIPQGTLIHYFLHGSNSSSSAERITMRYRICGKRLLNDMRRELDGQRPAGEDPQTWYEQKPSESSRKAS